MEHQTGGRQLEGMVVSAKMHKTCVVAVSRLTKHPKYLKYFKSTSRFKAHDESGEYKEGDRVLIKEVRPISKDKRWIIIKKLS